MKPAVWAWGAIALVAAAAAADLQVALRGQLSRVSPEEMAAGLAKLREVKQPGDVLVHSPLFTVTELKTLGDLRMRPDRPTEKVRARRRIVALDRVEAPMFGLGGTPVREERVGERLLLRVFEPEGDLEVPLFDLVSDLDTGMMRIERPIGRITARCTAPRAEGGWSCPGEAEWLYAAPRSLRIGGNDELCVWAHPTTGGAVTFVLPAPEAPRAGRKLVLEVKAGLVDDAVTGTPGGASVTTDILQSNRRVGQVVAPNQVGWHVGTADVLPGKEVLLRITTPRDGRRHHCLQARLLERPEGGS